MAAAKVNKTGSKRRVFNYSLTQRIENEYGRDLYNVSREVENLVNYHMSRLDKRKDDTVEINDISGLIDKLNEYSEKITDWAERTSSKFVYSVEKHDDSEWKKHSETMSTAMKRELKSADVGDELRKIMASNVDLIKSLPREAAERVHDVVMKNLTTGRRAESVISEIMKTGHVTKSRAKTIARTETSRAITGLMKVRSTNAGMNWFVWKVTHDNRLRKSHKVMDNVLVQWDDPPSPEKLAGLKDYGKYLPGSTYNCRCYPAPIIRLSDVSFPAKVYYGGKIESMSMKKFLGLPENRDLKVLPNLKEAA
jgi:SPP1 gp7 family putative phage head morphogenesis protein